MRKIIGFIFAFIALAFAFAACGSETYADKLKKEKKGIERFINDNKITTRGTYPTDHVFAENEYYLDPKTGVYFRVINPGNDEKPVKGKTDVYLRFGTILNLINENDTLATNNYQGTYMQFTYGKTDTYINSTYGTTYQLQMYYFLSQACVLPLEQGIGNGAEVSLIVPFANGSYYQQINYIPLYYARLVYTFKLDESEGNGDTEE